MARRMIWADTIMSAETVAQGTTAYTDNYISRNTTGYTAALITVSGSGSVTVTQQCSLNKIDWYDPVDDTNTAVGQLASAMTAGTRYVVYHPALAPFSRLKVVEGNVAAAVVTIRAIFQEEE